MTVPTDDILKLFDAALSADYTRVRRIGTEMAQALAKNEPEMAKALKSLLRRKGVPLQASGYVENLPVDAKSRSPLVEEQPWPTTPLFVDGTNRTVFLNFIEDAQNAAMLSEKGLSTRLSMLLSGPPGTGKSLLAGHIAAQLQKPLYVVRLDSVVSSFLGDTAKNLRNVFDFIPTRNAVLFLDEMDAVAKVRDDRNELGELKRVVNTLIQGLDSLDDRSVVIGATNHSQLLDPAIWRRFPYKIELGMPGEEVRADLWSHFLLSDEQHHFAPGLLAKISDGLTGAEIEDLSLAARRYALLDNKDLDLAAVAWATKLIRDGAHAMPDRNGLNSDLKRKLALHLVQSAGASGADVARLLGVTRQAISSYLKEERDGN
ncbi:AAA family ATPase [Shinella sp.]|uniref:AAA family ATPase n=1 Tax=Shinella sp. TaxID=1870904 RepID=UPI00289CFEAD|nr:AAA family ATPase [Shinella sp.]